MTLFEGRAMYRTLDASRIVATLKQLQRRVSERFPGAGLANVCGELTQIAEEAQGRAQAIARPDWLQRGIAWLVLIVGAALLAALGYLTLSGTRATNDLFGTLQGVDSAFNILILMGASWFFLMSLEDRRKRKLALKSAARAALHRARDRHASAVEGPKQRRLICAANGVVARAHAVAGTHAALPRLLLGNAVARLEGGRDLCPELSRFRGD